MSELAAVKECMSSKGLEQTERSLRHWVPYLLLAIGLLLTTAAASYVFVASEARDRLRFQTAAQQTLNRTRNRLETYIALLRAATGLFAASREVNRQEFHDYISRMDLARLYPGIQGIGYTKRFRREELDGLVRRMQQEGALDFHVWPEEPRDEYHAILYLEPLDRRNLAAIGYDMFTEPTRRAAMEQARDTGAPAASGKVKLVQEMDEEVQAGFLIYVPVYNNNQPVNSVEARRAALEGFVYSPFRADDLLHGILGDQLSPEITLEVYDGDPVAPEHLLHRANPLAATGEEPRFTSDATLQVAGRTWTLQFATRPEFEWASNRRQPLYILIGGAFASLLLLFVTRSLVRARDAAEQIAAELRQSEAALLENEVQLRAANRAKDEFLATVSHELRTPLNAILGWAHLLSSGRLDAESSRRALETIERNARAQAQIIDDIMDVSRVITGKLRIEARPVDLVPVVEAALDAVRPAAEARGIHLLTNFDPTAGLVTGDPGRLQQVVWNLLSNAIKFTPEGGRVTVTLERVGENAPQARLTVSDTGQGIGPEFLPYVFDRFRQADSSTTRTHGGLGLGLSIVRHLIEMHGGTVRAESEGIGRGAQFIITLPLARGRTGELAQIRRAAAVAASAQAMSDLPDLSGLRALVVDDEADARELVAATLMKARAEVQMAGSSAEALEKFSAEGADVLVCDIGMPGEDGYALIRRVREMENGAARHVPAIALTAYAGPEARTRALTAGFQLHITKPVEPAELLHAIASLVGRSGRF